jgi:hypothetical protein
LTVHAWFVKLPLQRLPELRTRGRGFEFCRARQKSIFAARLFPGARFMPPPAEQDYDAWLDPTSENTGALKTLLKPYPAMRISYRTSQHRGEDCHGSGALKDDTPDHPYGATAMTGLAASGHCTDAGQERKDRPGPGQQYHERKPVHRAAVTRLGCGCGAGKRYGWPQSRQPMKYPTESCSIGGSHRLDGAKISSRRTARQFRHRRLTGGHWIL